MAARQYLLIDGDLALHRAAHASHHGVLFDKVDYVVQATDLEHGKQRIDHDIGRAMRVHNCDRVRIALSDPKANWRSDFLPSYKDNRTDSLMDGEKRRPLGFWPLRDYMMETYPCDVVPSLEADDLLGIWSTGRYRGKSIILSYDKDLRTIPGKLSKSFTECNIEEVTREEADRLHLLQTLIGDRVDGYSGCPGVGKVKAPRILDSNPEDPWAAIVEAYEKAGLTEDEALRNARVARILRDGEYDFKRRQVVPWTPPIRGQRDNTIDLTDEEETDDDE